MKQQFSDIRQLAAKDFCPWKKGNKAHNGHSVPPGGNIQAAAQEGETEETPLVEERSKSREAKVAGICKTEYWTGRSFTEAEL